MEKLIKLECLSVESIFIPYRQGTPVTISVKGHAVLVYSRDPLVFEDDLALIGADQVREINLKTPSQIKRRITNVVKKTRASFIMSAHEGAQLNEVIHDLENELPWVQ